MVLQEVLDAVKSGEITQIYLSERTGLSPSAVSQICSATIKSPKHANAVALIEALKEFRRSAKKKSRQNTDEKQTKNRKSSVERGAA